MANLCCSKNFFLALLLLITECHLSTSTKNNYIICNQNKPYIRDGSSGNITVNHNKLQQLGRCTLTLITCERCVINFSTFGKDANAMCDEKIPCPCHLNFSTDGSMTESQCYQRGYNYRCPYVKISTSPDNRMVIIPSYKTNCQFSTISSKIYIDVCQARYNSSAVDMTYRVDQYSTQLYRGRWILGKFQNFTMCMNNDDRDLLLGTKGYIHLSKCSGICKLVLSTCNKCKIHFYMDASNLTGRNHLCLTIKISDKYKRGQNIKFSPSLFTTVLNYTTFSKAATLEICQSNIESMQLKMFYEVIEKLETKSVTNSNITLLRFPSFYPPSGETFQYYIEKPRSFGKLRLIFINPFRCADCSITIEFGGLIYYITSQIFIERVYTSDHPITLKYFTGMNEPGSSGFKAEIRYLKFPSNTIQPTANCDKYKLISTSGYFHFRTNYSDFYDCIWILVSVSVREYFSLAVKSSLHDGSHVNIHYGNTSEGQKLATLKHTESYYGLKLHAVYIRLQGYIGLQNKLDITYSFTDNPCTFDTFRCLYGECIPLYKKCNNRFDCLDHSDEHGCPLSDDSKKTYPWSYGLIIILVVTAFILLSVCLFFIIVCKIRRIRQTSRQNSSVNANHNHIRMNLTFEGELDTPPSYDEVMEPSNIQGNFNLAFNWSHNNCNEVAAAMPPTYQEYMRQISSTEDVNSRENNGETSSDNTQQQQTLTGSAVDGEDSLHRESTNENKDQTVPTTLPVEMNSLGNSLEISQPVLDVNLNSNDEVANYSNENLCRVQGAVSKEIAADQIITNTESYRLPENLEVTNISERQSKENSDVDNNVERRSVVVLSEQLANLVYI